MSSYKIIAVSLLYFLISSGCNSQANKVSNSPKDSSYVAPTPGIIPPAEFKHYQTEIKNYYENNLVRLGFNGGILVAKKGNIIFEAYNGFSNLKTKDSLNKHSAFHLASVSKTFTAMAVLKLAEMNKLNINDDIKKYFPELPYDGITIKLLLNHRSGLPNYTHFMDKLGWNKKQYCTNQDILDYLIKFKPLGTGRPDSHFSYCNTNYSLLALIIEKASKESYTAFLTNTFFKPLHMDDTYVFDITKDSTRSMPSYDYRGRQEATTFLDASIGDKNIYSTPEDLLKWDQALYSNEILSKETMEMAYTPYSNEKPGVRNYGLGWRMNVYPDGKKVIYHNGWWHGNNAVFLRMIQDSVTVIVLGNKYNANIYKSKKIAEVFNPDTKIEDEQ